MKFQIGDRVKHDYSSEHQGIVTELRDEEPYSVYVKWDDQPERNDWFSPEVLINLSRGGGPIALSSIGGE